jgi:hypothetical protein
VEAGGVFNTVLDTSTVLVVGVEYLWKHLILVFINVRCCVGW